MGSQVGQLGKVTVVQLKRVATAPAMQRTRTGSWSSRRVSRWSLSLGDASFFIRSSFRRIATWGGGRAPRRSVADGGGAVRVAADEVGVLADWRERGGPALDLPG